MKKQLLIIITLALLKIRPVTCVPSASLTTLPALVNGSICPTTVQMTCIISDLSSLRWFIDDVPLYTYIYSPDDESLSPITLPTQSGLDITITSVAPDNAHPDLFDATSTLTTNTTTLLQAFNMQDFTCGTIGTMSEPVTVKVDILGPPPPDSSATCSLVTSASVLDVSLQWSSSFNSQYAVERYRVSVDPDPSCSSNQVVPSEDYSCPGLDLDRNYSITVSAINCGDQEGESDIFTVLPQLLGPQSPGGVTVIPNPDIEEGLTVIWMESITISGNCSFSGAINYTLILEDSAGEVVEERVVSSSSDSSCSKGSCSFSFFPSSQICRVSIMANNMFGESNPAVSIIVPERSTTTNQILLAMGVVLLCVAIGSIFIMLIKGTPDPKSPLSLNFVMLVVGVVMIVVSVVLWVAVGFQVGLQDNTCDSTWQLARNNLIISAFVFSLLCTFLILILALISVLKKSRKTTNVSSQYNMHMDDDIEMLDRHKRQGTGEKSIDVKAKVEEAALESHYTSTQHPNTAKQLASTDKTSQYSHIQTKVVKKEEKHYHSLDHGKGKGKITGGASFQAQPVYEPLGTHSLPPCITMYKHITTSSHPNNVAQWFPCDRKWPIDDINVDKKLKVLFMNNCPKTWKYSGKKISCEVIMKFLEVSWKNCFEIANKEERNPHISVKYQDKSSGNWSAIGCEAKLLDPLKPTMILDFSNMSDNDIMSTVIHQFGHALGLGHALMNPEHWKALKPYLDLHAMMADCCAPTEKDLKAQWTGKNQKRTTINYDEDSVMQHSFSPLWLKLEFSKLPINIKEMIQKKKKTVLSTMDESILTVIKLAPPRYNLEPDPVIALKGESATMKFTVISDHIMPKKIKHTIRRNNGTTVRDRFFETSEDCITFPKVETSDKGSYVISCQSNDGLEGKESFELVVVPARPKYNFECDSMVGDNIVEAVVGENVVIPFTVTLCENTTLDEEAGHQLIKVNGTHRSTIKENCITFSQVKQSDEGTYKITCYNNYAFEGEKKFKLNVTQGTSPVYTLNREEVLTMAGDSPTISFTVKSHPPFAKEPVHKVYKKKDCSSFFNLLDGHNNIITFHDVKVSDSGLWVIQCTNPNGLSGEKSFKLKVYFPGTHVDTTILSEEEVLSDMMKDLVDVLPQYYKIGKMLGLQMNTLEKIKEERLDSFEAMTLIIKHWFNDDVRGHKRLTWKSLVEAVAHKNGGNNVALAMKLTDNHRARATDGRVFSETAK